MAQGLLPVYNRFPVTFVRGENLYLYDHTGKRYFDAGSGIAVNSLGHAHPDLCDTLTEQAKTLWHISNLYYSVPQKQLAAKLTALTGLEYVFFTNSGAEAIECAIKAVWRYFHHHGKPEKNKIVTFSGSFHGRTHLCISMTGTKTVDGYGTITDDFIQLPFGDHNALKDIFTRPDIAAIVIEPIQGEGGVKSVPHHCLQELRRLCDLHDVLLVCDEIQTGMGRTGTLFAYEGAGIMPDIVTSAKGIGGGFPLGACLVSHKAAAGMNIGTHGSTYGGNPLGCAVALTAVTILSQVNFLKNVQENGIILQEGLSALQQKYPYIIDKVRGQGLIMGVKIAAHHTARFVAEIALEQGLIVIPASDNVIRILPALIITPLQIAELIDLLDKTLHVMVQKG